MGQIKRDINTITDLKRGSTNVNSVYRGTSLVWQRATPPVGVQNVITTGIDSLFFKPNTEIWVTSGINKNFK